MKIFALAAFCLFLAVGNIQAQNTATVSTSTTQTVIPEQYVRDFMAQMVNTYNITNDQQYAVKKAGTALIDKARAAGKLNEKQKAVLVNEFNATIITILGTQHKTQYEQASQMTQPIIENIINAAVSK